MVLVFSDLRFWWFWCFGLSRGFGFDIDRILRFCCFGRFSGVGFWFVIVFVL